MRAEIKGLHSPDVYDLETYHPKQWDNFAFLLQIMVGPKGDKGEESFDVMVCTPQWLREKFGEEGVIFGRHYIIVFEYSYKRLVAKIERYVQSLEADNWQELALKLSRMGLWEFEDYRELKL